MFDRVEIRLLVEADTVDNERVTFVPPYGMSAPGGLQILRMAASIGGNNLKIAADLEKDRDIARCLDDLYRCAAAPPAQVTIGQAASRKVVSRRVPPLRQSLAPIGIFARSLSLAPSPPATPSTLALSHIRDARMV